MAKQPPRRLEILYLHQYFATPADIGNTRSYDIARHLIARGHKVRMVAALPTNRAGRSTGRSVLVSQVDGIEVHYVPLSGYLPGSTRGSHSNRVKSFAEFALRARSVAADLTYDIVYATSTPLTIAIPAVHAARRASRPMVFEIRDLWPEVPIAVGALRNPLAVAAARRLERFAYNNAARIIALSDDMKARLVDGGVDEQKIIVSPNGCDLERFNVPATAGDGVRRDRDWLQGRPMVLYAGSVNYMNGIDYLARIAASMKEIDADVRFLVLGHGRSWDDVRAEANRLGVLDVNFFMEPAVSRADLPGYLAASTIATSFILDVRAAWSNSANKFFDALAAARPVAINYGGWQSREIMDNSAGLVLPATDSAQAAAQLHARLRDSRWLANAGRAARELAASKYDRKDLSVKLESVFLEVTHQTSSDVPARQRPVT